MAMTLFDVEVNPPPLEEAPPFSGEYPPFFEDSTPNFDDEAFERDEFHCEKMAREFMESESPIRHDVLPDSDDEVEPTQSRESFKVGRGDGILYKGQTFFNGVAFKEAVVDYALHTGFNIKQYRYDRDKIGFKCVGGGDDGSCEWQVYASSLPKDPIWTIRVHKTVHKCIPNGHCELFKVPVIARIFVDKIKDDPDYYMPQKIEEIIKDK